MPQTINSAECLLVLRGSGKRFQSGNDILHLRFADLDEGLQPAGRRLAALVNRQPLIDPLISTQGWPGQVFTTADVVEQAEAAFHLLPGEDVADLVPDRVAPFQTDQSALAYSSAEGTLYIREQSQKVWQSMPSALSSRTSNG